MSDERLIAELESLRLRLRESEQRAEAARREGEAKYHTLFEAAGDAIFLLRADGNELHVLECNERALAMFSATREQLHEMPVPHFHAPQQSDGSPAQEAAAALVARALAGDPQSFEWRHRRLDGTVFDTDVVLTCVPPGAERRLLAIVRDATQRKRTEEAVRRTNETLEALIAASPLAIVTSDADRRIALWSPAAEKIFGWSAAEVVGRPYALTPPAREHESAATLGQALQGISTSVHECVRQRKDGSLVDVSVSTAPLRDAAGQIVGAMTILADITERRRADRELKASESTLRSVFQAVPIGIIFSIERVIVSANDSMCRITGYTQAELLGQNARMLYFTDEEYVDVGRKLYTATPSTGHTIVETRFRRKDGVVIDVRLTGVLLHADDPARGFVVTVQDITAQNRAAQEKEALEAQLQQAQKMEAIGLLAGGVAHDFNNILTAIFGHVELAISDLEAKLPAARKTLGDMQQIQRSAERASALTRQLLAFSRRQIVRPQVLDLNAMLRDVQRMLQRLITENIDLRMMLAPDLPAIEADPGQLEQVIINLVINARDAMPEGGTLVLATSTAALDESYAAAHPEAQPGEYVLLSVNDTGCGMDPTTLARIFEPFFTTKPRDRGTGLGLPTVYGIVKQAGGHIAVYSEPGRGTSVKVYLPSVHKPVTPVPAVQHAPAPPVGSETILLCEDDTAVRELAADLLRTAGYTVLVAQNAEDALQQAGGNIGPIHLLLTDVIMPGMNGRKLADALRARRPDTKTLFMSGYTSNVIAHHGVLEANVEFLEKPFSRPSLLQRVREVLDKPALTPQQR
jgi:two-component system, cell cycle sensor histidine kinase and response regulator CckA